MNSKKSSFVLLLGFLILLVSLSSIPGQMNGANSFDVKSSSLGTPPVVLDLGGGIADNSMIKTDYTEPFPWAYFPDHMLYWTVEFSNDTEITCYFFESIYGELDGLNGTFTPLSPAMETSVEYEPEFFLMYDINPSNFVDFGHNVTCWILDGDGAMSEHFTKLFKYHNGTVEPPAEELEFTVTTLTPSVNIYQNMEFDFTISDPDGPRTYQVDYSCNHPEFSSYSTEIISPSGATFTPAPYTRPAMWTAGFAYNFIFNLTVWESDVMVDSLLDTGMVYANTPPENGTCIITDPILNTDYEIYIYNISCSGWVDDLDGDGPFTYLCVNEIERENFKEPDYPHDIWSEATNQSEFQFNISADLSSEVWVWIRDSTGDYAEFSLGILGKQENPSVPGYSVYIMLLSIVPVAAGLLWKIKRKL